MTRSERIRLAEKAGFSGVDARSVHIERLVALVEAAEREECAKIADNNLMDTTALTSLPEKSRAAWKIAAAIRARGEK